MISEFVVAVIAWAGLGFALVAIKITWDLKMWAFSFSRQVARREDLAELRREIELLADYLGVERKNTKVIPSHYSTKGGPERGE